MMNATLFTDGSTITLSDVLANRDRRFVLQQKLNQQYHSSLLSLTLNIPGNIKNSHGSQILFYLAKDEILNMITRHQWEIIDSFFYISNCGYEQIWVLDGQANEIKQACINIEDSHQLGRLWDIDIFNEELVLLSRINTYRQCLICDNPAHECVRSQRHSIEQVLEEIEKQLNQFITRSYKM